ncbi:MAG: hypothetical protein GX456_00155 [Verrucomicrobia bacterium]|nr:hypothetical protein [Verrucomicrobiota bacterium]
MRLFEALLNFNERWLRGDKEARFERAEHADNLPIVALTCVDERLNSLLPSAVGLEAADLILLRTPGNIVGSPLGETARAIALACAYKGGHEIAVIGHTDCAVARTTVLKLTDALASAGLARDRLPDDLTEFFGLFASERQNVLKAVEVLRQSAVIGPKMPVHGLLIDVRTGRVEWLVNGYQAETAGVGPGSSELKVQAAIGDRELVEARVQIPSLSLGEIKLPELKIGEVTVAASMQQSSSHAQPQAKPAASGRDAERQTEPEHMEWLDILREIASQAVRVHIIGNDKKPYGPVPIAKLLEWVIEKRVGADTPAQIEGTTAWQPLSLLVRTIKQAHLRSPPPIPSTKAGFRFFRPGKKR